MNFTNIYRSFHAKATEHILLKCTGNIFQDIHILGHKKSLNIFKKIKIISSIFSNYNGIKLELQEN